MPVIESAYIAPFYLFSKHLQTILPALFRSVDNMPYRRERLITHDDDFLDLDWSEVGSEKLVIISHGLEGNTQTGYVRGMVKALNLSKIDTLAWNYRGCSGEINKQFRFYHSGETSDLDFIIQHACKNKKYTSITLIGFSIGGNITLKYLGEYSANISPLVKCAVTFSVPCHLESGAKHLAKLSSKIYMQRFISSLQKKIKAKSLIMPERLSADGFHKIKNFIQFDEIYTAPIHGFKNAFDYWTRNSSIYFLNKIKTPTLIINAKNDPFLTPECYPIKEATESKYLFLEMPETGGHVGFFESNSNGMYWSEKRAIEFINNYV